MNFKCYQICTLLIISSIIYDKAYASNDIPTNSGDQLILRPANYTNSQLSSERSYGFFNFNLDQTAAHEQAIVTKLSKKSKKAPEKDASGNETYSSSYPTPEKDSKDPTENSQDIIQLSPAMTIEQIHLTIKINPDGTAFQFVDYSGADQEEDKLSETFFKQTCYLLNKDQYRNFLAAEDGRTFEINGTTAIKYAPMMPKRSKANASLVQKSVQKPAILLNLEHYQTLMNDGNGAFIKKNLCTLTNLGGYIYTLHEVAQNAIFKKDTDSVYNIANIAYDNLRKATEILYKACTDDCDALLMLSQHVFFIPTKRMKGASKKVYCHDEAAKLLYKISRVRDSESIAILRRTFPYCHNQRFINTLKNACDPNQETHKEAVRILSLAPETNEISNIFKVDNKENKFIKILLEIASFGKEAIQKLLQIESCLDPLKGDKKSKIKTYSTDEIQDLLQLEHFSELPRHERYNQIQTVAKDLLQIVCRTEKAGALEVLMELAACNGDKDQRIQQSFAKARSWDTEAIKNIFTQACSGGYQAVRIILGLALDNNKNDPENKSAIKQIVKLAFCSKEEIIEILLKDKFDAEDASGAVNETLFQALSVGDESLTQDVIRILNQKPEQLRGKSQGQRGKTLNDDQPRVDPTLVFEKIEKLREKVTVTDTNFVIEHTL